MISGCRKFIIIKNPINFGVPRSFNQGLKVAIKNNTNKFLLTNNDIVFDLLTIDRMLSMIRNTKFKYITAFDYDRNYSKVKPGASLWEGLCMSCVIYNKEIIDRVGYFDENFGLGNIEDMDWMHRASLIGEEGRSYTKAIVSHEHSYTQRIIGSNSQSNLQKNKKYAEKKWGHGLGWI